MPAIPLTSAYLAVDNVNMTGFANDVMVSMSSEERDITTFASGGSRQKITTLGSTSVMFAGFQDDATTAAPRDLMQFSDVGGLFVYQVSIPGTTAGDASVFGQARNLSMTPIRGAVGDVADFSLDLTGTAHEIVGTLLHPPAARTSTGSGSAVAFTMPVAGQALHAAFNVHSVTGSGSITFTIQTDDAVGFPTATTRITSQAFTAVGAQFASVSGAIATETHIRAGWTISGFTSVTFGISVGVGAPAPTTP